MAVRAKFKVVDLGNPDEIGTIKLQPVVGGEGNAENDVFWIATPGGLIELFTVNEAAANQFILGKEYYVDFTPAE